MIKPYYETSRGKLYHADCLDILPEIEQVDLCLTDPPYGIGAYANGTMGGGVLAKQSSYAVTFDDTSIPQKDVFQMITKYR